MSQGYFWPHLIRDCLEYSKKCEECQRHGNMNHLPAIEFNMILSPWPFAKRGLDIVRSFVPSRGDVKYVLVATYYFTKWAEAKSFKSVTAEDVVNFIYSNIIYRFEIPNALIMDNGPQFDGAAMRKLCKKFKIQQIFSWRNYP